MISNASELENEYEKLCGAAGRSLHEATQLYKHSLESFIMTHVDTKNSMEQIYSNNYVRALYKCDCGSDHLTNVMILESIMADFIESNLENWGDDIAPYPFMSYHFTSF